MKTYILARELEDIPVLAGDATTIAAITHDCMEIAEILYGRASFYEERMLTIPAVEMWVNHEVAFFYYFKAFVNRLDELVKHHTDPISVALQCAWQTYALEIQHIENQIWGRYMDPKAKRVEYGMLTDPISDASDEMIESHEVAFVCDYPAMANMYPELSDLSLDYQFSWS